MQQGLTLVSEIAANWDTLARDLRIEGNQLQAGWPAGAPSTLDAVAPLHFLSLFVIPPDGPDPALLVLEASFDCSRDTFIDQLVQTNAPLLQAAYAHCVSYPPNATNQQLRAYLGGLEHCNQIFYVGCPGLGTQRIAEEEQIAADVEARIRALNQPIGRRAQIVREIWQGLTPQSRERVLDTPDRPFWVRHPLYEEPLATLYWYLERPAFIVGWFVLALVILQPFDAPLWDALVAPPSVVAATWCWALVLLGCAAALTLIWLAIWVGEFPRELTWRTIWYVIGAKIAEFLRASWGALPGFGAVLGLLALAHWTWPLLWQLAWIGLVVLAAAALVAAIVWVVRLLRIGVREPGDSVDDKRWDAARIARMREREDHLAQTHLISVTTIRPGALRLCTLRYVLFAIHWLARILYNRLGLFSTQSIHFARWTIIPGRRLLFISNYDGSFGGYLGVFATLGGSGVSAIWGNTEGFPRTFLLFLDGARDEQGLKARARASQVESLLWYRRYPRLSVTAIERNAAIRSDLARFSRAAFRVPEAELDAFLRRF